MEASVGTNALEVDISASNGAYVDGQFTYSINATTKTLSSNGGSSTRTDTIYVTANGSISVSEGATSAPSDAHKLAEADVATDDTISAVRNYGYDVINGIASETAPTSPSRGDEWFDSVSNEYKVYDNGWIPLLAVDGRTPLQGDLDVGGNEVVNASTITSNGNLVANGTLISNGSNLETDFIHDSDNGSVGAGNIAKVGVIGLDNNETLTIKRATLVAEDLSAVPTGVDLVIASASTSKTTIVSGDGSTVYDDTTNNASYTNTSGSHETLFVGVDNGHYNSGSGASQKVASDFRGVITQ